MIQITNDILIPQIADDIKNGQIVILPLRGFSMRPYLEDNRDKALLVAADGNLCVGDVILARISHKRWALHRITAIIDNRITMYGDGNYSPEHIKREDVIAKAVAFYRKGRGRPDYTNSIRYMIYWRLWVFLRPVRRYLLYAWKLYHYPKETIVITINKIRKRKL